MKYHSELTISLIYIIFCQSCSGLYNVLVSVNSHYYAFNCDSWFHGDAIKTLTVEDMSWHIMLTTSNLPGAGTDGDVSVIISGDQGRSRSIALDDHGDDFERAETSSFLETSVDVGTPTNITVTAGSDGKSNTWHLDKVRMVNTNGGALYEAVCNCWFETSSGSETRVLQLVDEEDY